MSQLVWLVAAGVGGTAAIFGSLMAIASLLLWLVPSQPGRGRKSGSAPTSDAPSAWMNRLKVTGIASAIALAGLGILLAVPFPT